MNVPEPLLALMLLNGACLSDNQRLSILAAADNLMPIDKSDISKIIKSESELSTRSPVIVESMLDSQAEVSKSDSSEWKLLATSEYLMHLQIFVCCFSP